MSGRRPGPWRSALPSIAGALRRSLLGAVDLAGRAPFGPEAPGSIRRRRHPGFHQPPGLSADARRVLVPFTARLRDVGGVCGGHRGASSVPGAEHLPMNLLPSTRRHLRRRLGSWLVSGTADDRQRRVLGEPRIRRRAFAEAECGAAAGLDDSRVAANAAQTGRWRHVAERVGFEPTKSFDSALFKSAAINHSATSPRANVAARRRWQRPGAILEATK